MIGGFIYMKKIIALCTLVVMACTLLVGCGGGDKTKAADQSKKKIVVGLDDNFPPMGFKDDKNQIVGFDIDMAKEAAKRLGREVEFKTIDWSSKEAELKSGRIDVLWNGLNITEKRKANMLFSDPYMDCKQLIFVPVGSPIKGQADLVGKTIGMQSGSTAEENLDADQKFKDSLKDVKKYADCISAMMDLQNGRIDAVVTDEVVGRYYMGKNKDKFIALETPVGPVGIFGIGFRKDDTALQGEIQKALNEMKKDGVTAKISEKWFGKDITK